MRWPPYVRDRHAARSRSTVGVLGIVGLPYTVLPRSQRVLLVGMMALVPGIASARTRLLRTYTARLGEAGYQDHRSAAPQAIT